MNFSASYSQICKFFKFKLSKISSTNSTNFTFHFYCLRYKQKYNEISFFAESTQIRRSLYSRCAHQNSRKILRKFGKLPQGRVPAGSRPRASNKACWYLLRKETRRLVVIKRVSSFRYLQRMALLCVSSFPSFHFLHFFFFSLLLRVSFLANFPHDETCLANIRSSAVSHFVYFR